MKKHSKLLIGLLGLCLGFGVAAVMHRGFNPVPLLAVTVGFSSGYFYGWHSHKDYGDETRPS